MKPIITNQSNFARDWEHFEEIRTGLIVLNRGYQVLRANNSALRMIGCSLDSLDDLTTCYSLFFKKTAPCEDCPAGNPRDGHTDHKSLTIKTEEGEKVFIKEEMSIGEDYILLTLNDVTREVSLLRTIDLTRKELNAKNILITQRHRQSEKELQILTELLDHLPEALVSVDKSFTMRKRNATVKSLFGDSEADKCHELIGKVKPCNSCPFEISSDREENLKISHKIGERYFTEIINRFPEGKGGLLTFRDTTRQIELIEQIRQQRETITKKNEILSGLVSLEEKMQKEADSESVLNYFLDFFLPFFQSKESAVVISDIRPGSIWFALQRNINEEQMNRLSKTFLSREFQSSHSDMIPENSLPWTDSVQFMLLGGDGRKVGVVLLKGHKSEESNELINLFKDPLGAYIHNQLLMRQLEERANKDPLTGLYNRGYLEQAIKEEEDKQKRLDIHYSIAVADVNGLKKANDVYGHDAGDRLILTVGETLRKTTRNTDIIARTGGDEFLILFTDTGDKGAQQFINRIQTTVFNNMSIEVGDNEKFPVTISLGAAGSDKISPRDLIKEADRLMYSAKKAYYEQHKRYR